ncbi:MAG: lamin tail domain-containing protein, partial [Elusimicrobia bacterium]|nr:lamin tail domain-containing protein [Elusimicrobiota bacterium]
YNTILSDGHHTFYVAARDNVGNTSAYGEHYVNVDVTKPASTTVDDPPQKNFDRITISWDSVTDGASGTNHYNVYRDTNIIDTNAKRDALSPIAQTTDTSYTDASGLTSGVTYYYVVCAVDNAANEADISNCVSTWAGNPPVLGPVVHNPGEIGPQSAAGSGSIYEGEDFSNYHFREPVSGLKKGDVIYFFTKTKCFNDDDSSNSETSGDTGIANQWEVGLHWKTSGSSYTLISGDWYSTEVSGGIGYKFWLTTMTITQSGGTTIYYYIDVPYTTSSDGVISSFPYFDMTYLYDPYGIDESSATAFESEAQAEPFKFIVSNTSPPAPTLISPNGGETLVAGDVWTISWSTVTDADGDTVYYDIDYSADGGTSWNGITSNATGSSYAWTIENVPTETGLIRIRAYDGADYSAFDQSNDTFTIKGGGADHIVISEVCIGWATGQSALEYIELYNPTDSDIDLKNYPSNGQVCSIMSTTDTGDILQNLLSSSAGTWINQIIPAKGYFLICSEASINGVSADADHAKDLAGADGIQLKDGDGNIIDMVAWGTKNTGDIPNCTETERVSSDTDLDSGWAIERKAFSDSTAASMAPGGADNDKGNAYDSDNNANDFVLHTDTNSFTPQNSDSTTEPPPNTTVPTLTNGDVSPSQGTTAKMFSFTITYTDAGNDRPSLAKVYIDGDSGHPMTTTDEDFTNGAEYIYQTNLGVGSHNYYFSFSDGKYFVRYPESGTLSGPDVGPNLTTVSIVRPDTPAENEIVSPGTIVFDCRLSGEGPSGDLNGSSSFEARLQYSKDGGATWETPVDMTQDSASADGNYFTTSIDFIAGDCVKFYFQGRDSDSTDWTAVDSSDEGYFTVGLISAWHLPTTQFKNLSLYPSAYRDPVIPDETEPADIFAGCETSTATAYVYYCLNALPQEDSSGTPLSGTQRLELNWDFSLSSGTEDREGEYFTTRPSTNPIPAQDQNNFVYYYIKFVKTGYPTTYLITDGQTPEGTILRSFVPSTKSECFNYYVGEANLIDAFHIPSSTVGPSNVVVGMREVWDTYNNVYLYPHRGSGQEEEITVYFGKNSDATDYDGGTDDLTARLYWKEISEQGWPRFSTFTYYSTEGSTDYWKATFTQPDDAYFVRGATVAYYISLKKASYMDTVIYPGKNNQDDPDNNSDTTLYEDDKYQSLPYDNATEPKFWYVIVNYPPVMQSPTSPADYASGIDVSGGSWNFKWESATDYDGDSIANYYFEISDNINFASVICSSTTLTNSFLVPSGLSNGNVYYWRVKAKDSYGDWGDWCNNNSHWTFFTTGAPMVRWVSMKSGGTDMTNLSGSLYSDIKNSESVEVKFTIYPSSSSNCQARVYYTITKDLADPVLTIADSTSTTCFFFRADDTPNGTTNGSFGTITTGADGETSTATITIPADVHYVLDDGWYFWVQPCARLSDGSWLNAQARCYRITEDGDTIEIGRGAGDKEWPSNPTAAEKLGDSNDATYVANYSPLWHNPDEYLIAGNARKYITPLDSEKRVEMDIFEINTSNDYLTEQVSDGKADIFYSEDPGIYLRTEYKDLGNTTGSIPDCSVVFSYDNFAHTYMTTLKYKYNEFSTSISTDISPYHLRYSFAKALAEGNILTMPESATIKYYFKLKQGSSSEYYVYSDGVFSTEAGTPFEYDILQDDYTRPFVWRQPSLYVRPGDTSTVAGRSLGYITLKIGLADTKDGKFTDPDTNEVLGPFRTWPGGWETGDGNPYTGAFSFDPANKYEFLRGDIENNLIPAAYKDDGTYHFGNYVYAKNISTWTENSGVVSMANNNNGDGLTWRDSRRWAHQTICWFAYMDYADECNDAGFRNGSPENQLIQIGKVDYDPVTFTSAEKYHKHHNVATNNWESTPSPPYTVSGAVIMSPLDVDSDGNGVWYARIPIPPNVEEIPYLYYRIWVCNGDFDPQARNNERGGGGRVDGTYNAGYPNGTGFGNAIDDPYLSVYPLTGVSSPSTAGGKYRDCDYGWVTRSLFAGRVTRPPEIRITATTAYKSTERQAVAYIKVDEVTKKPVGVISIQFVRPGTDASKW